MQNFLDRIGMLLLGMQTWSDPMQDTQQWFQEDEEDREAHSEHVRAWTDLMQDVQWWLRDDDEQEHRFVVRYCSLWEYAYKERLEQRDEQIWPRWSDGKYM